MKHGDMKYRIRRMESKDGWTNVGKWVIEQQFGGKGRWIRDGIPHVKKEDCLRYFRLQHGFPFVEED